MADRSATAPATASASATDAAVGGRGPLAALVGAGLEVPCLDGTPRPYRDLDCAASTPAMAAVAERGRRLHALVLERAPRRRLQVAHVPPPPTRTPASGCSGSAGGPGGDDVAILCRNTTEALNHLAYRLRFAPGDVVVTTVVEHHANLLPWARVAQRRYVECDGRRDLRRRRRGRRPRRRATAEAAGGHRWRPTSPAGSPRSTRSARRPTPGACRWSSTRPSSRPTGRSRPRRSSWPSAATSSTRPYGAGRSGRAARAPSPRATPSWPAAERSTWSTSTR